MGKRYFLFLLSCCLLLVIGDKAIVLPCFQSAWSASVGKEKTERSELPEEKRELEEKESKEKNTLERFSSSYSFYVPFPAERKSICLFQSTQLPISYHQLPTQPPQGSITLS